MFKTFFAGNLEHLDSPQPNSAILGNFESNTQIWGVVLLEKALSSHFSAGSDTRTKYFEFLNFGEI